MHILFILGSRNHGGQTARAAQACLEGIREAGSDGEIVHLPEMRLERCRQCEESGWGLCRAEGRCVIGDDFTPLSARLENADVLVFATPVYFGDLSESMRGFLDRLRRVCRHHPGGSSLQGKPALGIAVAGGGGGGAPACLVQMEKILQTTGVDLIDLVPVRRQNLAWKLPILRETGKNLAGVIRV